MRNDITTPLGRLQLAQGIRSTCAFQVAYHRRRRAYWLRHGKPEYADHYGLYADEWSARLREARRDVWHARREWLASVR